MPKRNRRRPVPLEQPWQLVLCLIGVDYFSTLAYLPSMAVEAAGPLAPMAAGGVVLVTFLLAMPIYWYLVSRSSDGRGTAGIFEEHVPGWRGKILVLTLLGFAAADFVITRSLSLADAAIHLIHNPHGQRLLASLPSNLSVGRGELWRPLDQALVRLLDPQVAITVLLAVASFALWRLLKQGLSRRILFFTAGAVTCYLALAAVVILSAFAFVAQHPSLWRIWQDSVLGVSPGDMIAPAQQQRHWLWAWIGAALWSFPQLALGLSGFEMVMTTLPRVSGGRLSADGKRAAPAHNARKLMLVAAAVMGVYLIGAVFVTTLLVPREALLPSGAAEHRALAYLAHGSPVNGDSGGAIASPLFGDRFGDFFDISSAIILCLAGASVTLGLQNLLPHYLNRLGMELSWAGRVGVILNVLNVIVLVVTVIFRASPASQQWAYATSVLVLLAGASTAVALDLQRACSTVPYARQWRRLAIAAATFFLVMTGVTATVNRAGLTIALLFVSAIVVSSFISRWVRSTELRLEGFDFADAPSTKRWSELRHCGPKCLVPHRPGWASLMDKHQELHRAYRIESTTAVLFIEVSLGDPSNFYQRPLIKIEHEGSLEVLRVSRCVSVSHVLAAICLELCREGVEPPQIIFGWSHESPMAANLNFLLLGEGNIPWMVKELLRAATPDGALQPRVRIG